MGALGLDPGIDIDLRDVFDGFKDIEIQSRDLRQAWKKLEPLMKADQLEHFRLKTGPERGWEARKESTIGRHGKRRLLGKLRTGFTIDFDREQIRAVTLAPWSQAHQDGATVGHGTKLPKRVHRYMSQAFLLVADQHISELVFGVWDRKAKRRIK